MDINELASPTPSSPEFTINAVYVAGNARTPGVICMLTEFEQQQDYAHLVSVILNNEVYIMIGIHTDSLPALTEYAKIYNLTLTLSEDGVYLLMPANGDISAKISDDILQQELSKSKSKLTFNNNA